MKQNILSSYLIKDIIKPKKLITVQSKMTAREVALLFAEKNITGAPVVNDKGELIGVVSITDITRSEAIIDLKGVLELIFFNATDEIKSKVNQHINENYKELTVSDIMTPLPITASNNDNIYHIVRLMIDNKIRRVIITDNNKPIGIISISDILSLIVNV